MLYDTIFKGREPMNTKVRILIGCIGIIAGLLISGCNSNLIEYTAATNMPTATAKETAINQTVSQPDITVPIKRENKTPIIEKSGDQATVASNAIQHLKSTDAAENSLQEFNTKQPKIMGLAIGELQEKVITLYGKPLESYIMDDPTEPVTVYTYDGFSIGFNAAKEILFIDVSSAKVNPDLNGLRLGQTSTQALEALGKPDKNTSYVISYNTKTAILKLDIDPKTKSIQSIKLFGVNEP
jgi:outer membrane murein-binding lipoprotein Lpp